MFRIDPIDHGFATLEVMIIGSVVLATSLAVLQLAQLNIRTKATVKSLIDFNGLVSDISYVLDSETLCISVLQGQSIAVNSDDTSGDEDTSNGSGAPLNTTITSLPWVVYQKEIIREGLLPSGLTVSRFEISSSAADSAMIHLEVKKPSLNIGNLTLTRDFPISIETDEQHKIVRCATKLIEAICSELGVPVIDGSPPQCDLISAENKMLLCGTVVGYHYENGLCLKD